MYICEVCNSNRLTPELRIHVGTNKLFQLQICNVARVNCDKYGYFTFSRGFP